MIARVESILQESGTIIQPSWRSVYRHLHPRVKGLEAHQAFEFHMEEVWIDPDA